MEKTYLDSQDCFLVKFQNMQLEIKMKTVLLYITHNIHKADKYKLP
jgi:hypothetical protein